MPAARRAARAPSFARSSSRTARRPWLWLALSALVVVLDQLSKTLVTARLKLGDVVPYTSFFDLVRAHNRGAAFSMLADAGGWQRWFFLAIGLAACGFMVWMLLRHPGQRLFAFAVAMILGGALGNVIDRALHGHVIDFLQFHWSWLEPVFRGGYFPAFNLADAAITAGAIGLILDELRRVRHGG